MTGVRSASMKRVVVLLVLAGALGACGGDDKTAAPTTVATTVDALRRTETTHTFLDAAANPVTCWRTPARGVDCLSQTTMAVGIQDATNAALKVPGEDLSRYRDKIRSAGAPWATCVNGAKALYTTCNTLTTTLVGALGEMYDALR